MKNKILRLFCGCLIGCGIAVAATSCSDDNDPTYYDEVRVSTSYVAIPAEGGSTSITVTATSDWAFVNQQWIQNKDTTNAAAPQWLTVSTVSGNAGQTTITFSADGSLDGRTCELLLSVGDKVQHINVIQGLSQVASATVAEVMAGPEKTYRVTGTVTNIANTIYGNWYMNDGTSDTDLYIYGTLDKNGAAGQNNSISVWGIEIGDEITIEGPKQLYGSTVELVNVTVININKSLIKVDSLSTTEALPKEGGDITAFFTCKGNGYGVDIPAEAKSWLTISSIEAGSVTFHASENSGADRSATIVFTTTDTAGKQYTSQTVISQQGVAKGTGTEDDPFNVAAAISYTRALGSDVKSTDAIFVKGIVSSIKYTYSAQYGTATYNISDDGTENGVFTVYGSYYFDHQPWTEEDEQIKLGDEVIVTGTVVNYGGTTPEFVNKENWLVSLNGKTSSVVASVAEFLAAEVGDTRYSLTGVISNLYYYKESIAGFYIKDYSGETLVYKADGFTGTEAKVGDIVTAVGKRGAYKDSPQMVSGKMELNYSVQECTVTEFLTKPDSKDVYYMVTGTVKDLLSSAGKENDYGNMHITDGTSELYVYGCYPGWGAPKGDAQKGFVKTANIEVGDKLTMIGYKATYNGLIEICGGTYFSHEKKH